MERYTQFRDKATGISPFMPVTQTNVIGVSESPLQQFLKSSKLEIIGEFILVLVKLALVSPLAILAFVLSNSIGYSYVVSLNRLVAFIVGLNRYELSVENLKSRQLNRKQFYPCKNEVYFVNFTSPLDLLSMILISNDEFVILIPNKQGNLQLITKHEFLEKSLSGLDISSANEVLNYDALKDKVVYIFAEGTTSNGKSILPFLLNQDSFDRLLENLKIKKVKSIGIKHFPSVLVTPLQSSPLQFFYSLMAYTAFNSKLRINNVNELNPLDNSLVKIRNSFANNGKFKLVNSEFNADMKSKFISTFRKK